MLLLRTSLVTAAFFACLARRTADAFTPQEPLSLTTNNDLLTAANAKSPFVNSRWNIQLNFGLEPGSFMPQRFPDWAASGARLGVPVELLFTDIPVAAAGPIPDNAQEFLDKLGSDTISPVYRVKVSSSFNSTFVSERGEERVEFSGGGYAMQRSMMMPAAANTTPPAPAKKPRFLLRFWIDCSSGAKRRDVEFPPNTRFFGTIPIWDDPNQIARLEQELTFVKNKRTDDEDIQQTMAANKKSTGKSNSLWSNWFFSGGEKKKNDDDASLSYRQEQLERLLPLKGSVATGDVTPAPKGSLVMPHQAEKKQNYFIVGSFAMKPPILRS